MDEAAQALSADKTPGTADMALLVDREWPDVFGEDGSPGAFSVRRLYTHALSARFSSGGSPSATRPG